MKSCLCCRFLNPCLIYGPALDPSGPHDASTGELLELRSAGGSSEESVAGAASLLCDAVQD